MIFFFSGIRVDLEDDDWLMFITRIRSMKIDGKMFSESIGFEELVYFSLFSDIFNWAS